MTERGSTKIKTRETNQTLFSHHKNWRAAFSRKEKNLNKTTPIDMIVSSVTSELQLLARTFIINNNNPVSYLHVSSTNDLCPPSGKPMNIVRNLSSFYQSFQNLLFYTSLLFKMNPIPTLDLQEFLSAQKSLEGRSIGNQHLGTMEMVALQD